MPNGFHGSKKDWERIESPLRLLDAKLQEYATRFGMTLSQNYHNWPERSLTWSDGLRRQIQVFRETVGRPTYAIVVAAWQDSADGRFVKQEVITARAVIGDLEDELFELLDKGRVIVNSWSEGDLKRVRE